MAQTGNGEPKGARAGRSLAERAAAQARADRARIEAFAQRGGLDRPAYALSPGLETFDPSPFVRDLARWGAALERLWAPARNDTGYAPGNGYFEVPDAAALHLLIQRFAPKRVVEIGCGHSTRVTRQAILDGGLGTELIAIDPHPRAEIAHLVDRFERAELETVAAEVFAALGSGDVLFIDSSHQVRVGNDVAHLFCRIIPALAPGVLIHVHDVFLPYEYPERFCFDCPAWGEQYLLHALLQGGGYDILWPGYYLQKERPDAMAALPFLRESRAQSFWIRKR